MAIIIVGVKNRIVKDDTGQKRTTQCGQCGKLVSLEPVRIRKYFSLFFIPLIPLNKGNAAYRCPNCKTMYTRREGDQ